MQYNVPRVCIVVLSGIPGSGKTYLGQELKRSLLSRNDGTCAVLVEYDQILKDCGVRSIDGSPESVVASPWRSGRKEVAECVRALVESVITNTSDGGAGFQRISLPGSAIACRFGDVVTGQVSVPISCERLAIIVDDNMYYRSMRYEYYLIAKSYGVGFAEAHVDVPLSTAMTRNSKRKESVPEDIITNMASRIEPPDVKHSWELNSCSVPNDGSRSSQELVNAALLVVDCGFVNPVIAKATTSNASSLSDVPSVNENVIHQADILLRRLVSDHVTLTKRSGAGKNDLQQAARIANDARQYLLCCLKDGNLYLPDFTTAVGDLVTSPACASDAVSLTKHGLVTHAWQNSLESWFGSVLALGK